MKKKKKYIFTDEQIQNFVALGETLRRVHARLLAEGYKIKNGKITPPKLKKSK